jgi:hypothetical protein
MPGNKVWKPALLLKPAAVPEALSQDMKAIQLPKPFANPLSMAEYAKKREAEIANGVALPMSVLAALRPKAPVVAIEPHS